MIDLRSDTVTRPSREMLAAMAAAELGDEQEREDPTVNELQRRVAELLGHEAALFLPTATMANQVALRVHTRPGGQLVAEERTHILVYEAGGPAAGSAGPTSIGARPAARNAGRCAQSGCRLAKASTSHLLPASSKLTCTRACAPLPS